MTENVKKCIYCGAVNPAWAKAHIMPRLMGTFKNQPTLGERICVDCDHEVGKCEEHLAKCTINGVLLKHLGLTGRHKYRSSAFRRGHSGQGPIRMTTRVPGYAHEVRVEPIGDSKNVDIIPQLILVDACGGREEIAIENPNCISLGEWKILLYMCREGRVKDLEAIGLADNQVALIIHIFQKIGLTFDPPQEATIPRFSGTILTEGTLKYDERYFRAIAKIAFHYYLAFNDLNHCGSEDIFEPVRSFIRYGHGKVDTFVTEKKGHFVEDMKQGWRPPTYGHILFAETTSQLILVKVQPFVGPDYEPPYYDALLSEKPFAIFVPKSSFGHNYSYLEAHQRKQYCGTMHKLAVASRIKVARELM